MAGQVQFIVSAESAGAVNAFLKLVEAQKKTEDGAKKNAKSHGEHNAVLEKTGETLKDIAHEAIATVTAFLSWEGIKKIIEEVEESLKQAREEMVMFQETAIKAQSLPVYRKNLGQFKQTSLEMSNKYGVSYEQVNQLRGQVANKLPSADLATLDQESAAALDFSKKTGAAPGEIFDVTRRLREANPKLDLKQSQGLSLFLREKGGLEIDQQRDVLEKILPTGEQLGYSVDQEAAMAAMASKMGGADSAMAQGLRGAMSKFGEMHKKRLLRNSEHDPLADFKELDQLQTTSPVRFNEIMKEVGPKAAPAVHFMATHTEAFHEAVKTAEEYRSGKPAEELSKELEASPELAAGEEAKRIEQQKANLPLTTTSAGDLAQARTNQLADLGADKFVARAPINSFSHVARRGVSWLMSHSTWLGGKDYLADYAQSGDYHPVEMTAHTRDVLAGEHPPRPSTPGGKGVEAAAAKAAEALREFHEAVANDRTLNGKPLAIPHRDEQGINNYLGRQ